MFKLNAHDAKNKTEPMDAAIVGPGPVAALNYNEVLGRDAIASEITDALDAFQKKKNDLTIKRGIYLYGNPGVGKTEFIVQLLKTLNYDMVLNCNCQITLNA